MAPPGRRTRGERRIRGDAPGAREARGRAFVRVWNLVRRIPPGRVMTYGQIAGLLGNVLSPRAVGWAMHGCPPDVPWQRVVNARGGCSTERMPGFPPGIQRALLEEEGIEFRPNGTLDLARYRWEPPPSVLAVVIETTEEEQDDGPA